MLLRRDEQTGYQPVDLRRSDLASLTPNLQSLTLKGFTLSVTDTFVDWQMLTTLKLSDCGSYPLRFPPTMKHLTLPPRTGPQS